MKPDRRHFLRALGLAGVATLAPRPARYAIAGHRPAAAAGVGICDWNLPGQSADPEQVRAAREAGLDGIQVSVGTAPDRMPLRDPAVRRRYLEAGKRHGIAFPSVAAGRILNQIPLKSEPESAVYVIDAVEAAAALGSTNILMAFFGKADLRLSDAAGNYHDEGDGAFSRYTLDEPGVERVVAAMRQIAPRAEDAGIILGLENTLTARQNLAMIEAIGSPIVQVYYDVGNSTRYGYDVPGELRLLGRERICEVHLKETLGGRDPQGRMLGGLSEGGVDFPAVADALHDIGYDRWLVLETSGRENRFVEDTRTNAAFVRKHFMR